MLDAKKVLAEIEPVAAKHASVDTEMIASIAISLRRIADALQPTNQSGSNTIPEAIFGIMMNGRS